LNGIGVSLIISGGAGAAGKTWSEVAAASQQSSAFGC